MISSYGDLIRLDPRTSLTTVMRRLQEAGLNRGATGNASVRTSDGMLITPTGVPTDDLTDEMQVAMDLDGNCREAQLLPSSEWRFHRDIYRTRPAVGAVVHVHSPHATALAATRRHIPAFHYMISIAGGDSIRCAPYALFGSQALSDVALEALIDRNACLLANHGMLALGATLQTAYNLALAVEDLAEQYCLALQCGGPVLLSAGEMTEVLERFQRYGQQR